MTELHKAQMHDRITPFKKYVGLQTAWKTHELLLQG